MRTIYSESPKTFCLAVDERLPSARASQETGWNDSTRRRTPAQMSMYRRPTLRRLGRHYTVCDPDATLTPTARKHLQSVSRSRHLCRSGAPSKRNETELPSFAV